MLHKLGVFIYSDGVHLRIDKALTYPFASKEFQRCVAVA